MVQFFGATAPLRPGGVNPHGPQKNVNNTIDKRMVLWYRLAHAYPRKCEILPKKLLYFWALI
jgi:hypothetical protein